jgi:hypothetical protein
MMTILSALVSIVAFRVRSRASLAVREGFEPLVQILLKAPQDVATYKLPNARPRTLHRKQLK